MINTPKKIMIQEFKTYLINVRGYSHNTADSYGKDLRHFVTWYKQYSPQPRWSYVNREDIDAYMIYMTNNQLQPATINRHLSSLSALFKYMKREGMTEVNPVQYESRHKLQKKVPNTVNITSIEDAIKHADETTALALRLLIATGIRAQELLDIEVNDIDFQQRRIMIHGKGAKERWVYYDEKTGEMLSEYAAGKRGRLMPYIDQRSLRYEVYNALRPYSHDRQLSPHAIRHTYATTMAKNGAPTTTIAALLGHERLETTQKYVNLGIASIQKQYNQYGPLFN